MNDGTAKLNIRRLSTTSGGSGGSGNNMLPVGFEYFTLNKNVQFGSLPMLGGEYSRTTYADLWSFANEQPNYLIDESAWQALFVSNNGNVPYYSKGDGTTTFRVPSLKCWVKGANGIEEVGSYLEVGLPNITGYITEVNSGTYGTPAENGALYISNRTKGSYGLGDEAKFTLNIDASRSNAIYGKSEEVTPESIVGLYCVVAFGTVVNEGILDVQSILNQFTQIQSEWSKVNTKIDYSRKQEFVPNKTSITIPPMEVKIDDTVYTSESTVTLNLSSVGSAEDLSGKDVYIYACQPNVATLTTPDFILSLNGTVPDGYNADNSRKIGGFHCLCADVGTISGHKLSGYVAGDILPASVWDLMHRPKCSPEGMVYIDKCDIWMDIYLNSWDGSKLVSVNGGTTADGASTKKFHGELFVERLADINKRLPWRQEFQIAAKGSNEQTNIQGSNDKGTTGGHVDTAGRRMISDYGLEDACGFLWQWASDVGFAGGSGFNNSVYDGSVDDRSYGQSYGTLYRAVLGGYWNDGSSCGSRSVVVNSASAAVNAYYGGRGACEPKIWETRYN